MQIFKGVDKNNEFPGIAKITKGTSQKNNHHNLLPPKKKQLGQSCDKRRSDVFVHTALHVILRVLLDIPRNFWLFLSFFDEVNPRKNDLITLTAINTADDVITCARHHQTQNNSQKSTWNT